MTEGLERRLDDHLEADREAFAALREDLTRILDKLDLITERTVRLDTLMEVSKTEASKSGAKWSAVVAIVISGLAQGCQWVTKGGQ